jgi:biotin-[acetyl-CoA-carboxylase] ligase BirA-like protein
VNSDLIRARLESARGLPPFHLYHEQEVDSTNTRMMEAMGQGGPLDKPWAVLVADGQLAGKGSHGRSWECPAGEGLLFSLRVDLSMEEHALSLVGHWAALALCQALEESCVGHPSVRVWWKWPNDILLEDGSTSGKVAGILIQSQVQGDKARVVLGMGVNLGQVRFPLGLRQPARSLRQAGVHEEREALLTGILLHLGRLGLPEKGKGPPADLLKRDILASRPACLQDGHACLTLVHRHDPDGPLHLRTQTGTRMLTGGGLRIDRVTREELWCSLEH